MNRRTNRQQLRGVRRAFTLLEVIVVITIIAIIATLVVPRLLSRVGSAKRQAATAEIATIAAQIKLYLLDTSQSNPDDNFDLSVLLLPEEEGGGPSGPYFEKEDDIIDPWGNTYVVRVPGEVNKYSFDVVSYAADGQLGGEGENEDVTN